MKNKCKKMKVPKDVCYLSFGKGKIGYSEHQGWNKLTFQTIRDEEFIIDFTSKGKIIGVELVNPSLKRCQGRGK